MGDADMLHAVLGGNVSDTSISRLLWLAKGNVQVAADIYFSNPDQYEEKRSQSFAITQKPRAALNAVHADVDVLPSRRARDHLEGDAMGATMAPNPHEEVIEVLDDDHQALGMDGGSRFSNADSCNPSNKLHTPPTVPVGGKSTGRIDPKTEIIGDQNPALTSSQIHVGDFRVAGYVTSSSVQGRDFPRGSSVQLNMIKAVVKQGRLKGGRARPKAGGAASAVANSSGIIRFGNMFASDIGRLEGHIARPLVPLVQAGIVEVKAFVDMFPLHVTAFQNVCLVLRVVVNACRIPDVPPEDDEATSDSVLHEKLIEFLRAIGASYTQRGEGFTDTIKVDRNGAPYDEEDQPLAEEQAESLLFQVDQINSKLQEIEAPEPLQCSLRTYQKQALWWLVHRESAPEREIRIHPLWAEVTCCSGGRLFVDSTGLRIVKDMPKANPPPRGGVLADEMGLGKTVEMISLLVHDKQQQINAALHKFESDPHCGQQPKSESPTTPPSNVRRSKRLKVQNSPPKHEDVKSICDAKRQAAAQRLKVSPTLVVTPLSILNQWQSEIQRHVAPDFLQTLVYYNSGGFQVDDLSSAEVVITTYGVLCSDWQKNGPLSSFQWRRVILDEAHAIKSRSTTTARAAFSLLAERRWAVTGTPIQNSVDDAFSLLKFMRMDKSGDWHWWNSNISKPLKDGDAEVLLKVRTMLEPVILLRRKSSPGPDGKPIIQLPPKQTRDEVLEFSDAERDFYDALYRRCKTKFDEFVATGRVLHNYATILELLLRMRQACDHPYLCMARADVGSFEARDFDKLARQLTNAGAAPSTPGSASLSDKDHLPQYVKDLVLAIAQGKTQECPICLEPADDPVVTICGHLYCRCCLDSILGWERSGSCPICRKDLTARDLISAPRTNKFHRDLGTHWRSSSKLEALLNFVKNQTDPEDKVVIFSQWTTMLDLLAHALEKEDLSFVRLDGSMPLSKRDAAVNQFCNKEGPKLMIMSLKAGGVGLNLTVANHVVLLDPWWNPAVEEQALNRVHRVGQTKPVTVVRLIVRNSVEGRILRLQEKKAALAAGALTMSKSQLQNMRIEDLKLLFSRDAAN